jgi:predicted enzyme related to lactoylglutathione lyase
MPRPIHFEIHASEPERAIGFYSRLFGWEFNKWPGPMEYWLVTTGPDKEPGINGGLIKRQGHEPAEMAAVNAYVCTIDVPDIDAHMEKADAAGARTAVPKMAIPGVGWLCYYKDTEGNIFGMTQSDASAQ